MPGRIMEARQITWERNKMDQDLTLETQQAKKNLDETKSRSEISSKSEIQTSGLSLSNLLALLTVGQETQERFRCQNLGQKSKDPP